MYLKIIDFSRYTSLKIGSALPVWVLEKNDEKFFYALESSKVWDRLCERKLTHECMQDTMRATKCRLDLLDLATNLTQTTQITPTKKTSKKPYTCIGNGYNLLISPNAKNLVLLSNEFDYITKSKDSKNTIEVGAKTSSSSLFRFCKEHNLGGLEFLSALPGSVGGLVKMNAGMKQYEIKDTLIEACINGKWRRDFALEYRTSDIDGIISAARFSLKNGFDSALLAQFKQMRKTHPKEPSCGSCFKNPSGDYAGRLIEAVGLKGVVKNGVGFSDIHANFLVNISAKNCKIDDAKNGFLRSDFVAQSPIAKRDFATPNRASFEDAIDMIERAKCLVKRQFDITLIPEVQIIK
ncbi:UDP-N-acetylmuramate dehydrogenase [Helicobacter sp. T3_23-1059]